MAVRRKHAAPDEVDVYALAAIPVLRAVHAADAALRVLRVGPIAVIGAPARRRELCVEDAMRRQHAIVLELAEQIDPLLPVRFGSRVSAARVAERLRPSIPVLLNALEHVRGRRQMTIRLIGPQPLKNPPRQVTTGTAYLAQRRSTALDLPPALAPLSAALQTLVVDRRMQPGRAGVHATLFHLVRREDVPAYRRAIESARPSISPWSAVVTGPWPPFAFAPELVR
jgi:hypothetical protein